jgi:hypothetical protein
MVILSDSGDGGTLYQSATINCGKDFPPVAGRATQRLSVPWHVASRSGTGAVFAFSYPACGNPSGGQEHGGHWYILVTVPLGERCPGRVNGRQEYVGRRIPAAGRVGIVRSTTTDPLAAPIRS